MRRRAALALSDIDGGGKVRPSLKRLAVGALLATAIALAAAAPSGATASIAVSGSVVPTSAALTARTADGNTIITGSGTHDWAGSLTGTSVIDVHFVVHPSGAVTAQGFLTFAGTTPCGTGTVHLVASVSGPFPGPITGEVTTIDQADASVPLHANLDVVLFLTPAGAVGTYTGDVRCG
jgi:hypothetical protein